MSRAEVLSYGGGIQSVATALLIAHGELRKPDMVVFADTGREVSTTLQYAERYTFPLLRSLDIPTHVVKASDYGMDDLWRGNSLLLPVFQQDGSSVRKLRGLCSYEWKRRPIQRFLREQGVESARIWLCISVDEWMRAKDSREQWYEHWYPLIEKRITRTHCVALIQAHGWPIPHKSRCWCCPYQSQSEWQSLRNFASDWNNAVELDETLRQQGYYLVRSCKPLPEAVAVSGQLAMDDLEVEQVHCDGGTCFV